MNTFELVEEDNGVLIWPRIDFVSTNGHRTQIASVKEKHIGYAREMVRLANLAMGRAEPPGPYPVEAA